ncbi:glycosyltransferase involved in cell wall biosynthesis [Halomonas ventosae]|uniref:Glycosyltransferase involved in cell wall biosynthesis n=1 Tax=Halomonas ventosae TaxID=229007 RepID=A0A4R6ZLS2_9GAMM|nr:glycosyltransferase [Halomonas ventosae]TDR53370.1 glycosyltransferase involved in cell wall biosynthesis [Halomonas ventosae]
MNVLMFTNTYLPIVGGVSESVQRLKHQLQAAGHRVLVVAPRLEGQPREERDVVRVVAVQHFNGSDFSLPVPIPGQLHEAIEAFEPDIVHAHHPFLLGDTAARAAETYGLPLVFTHHTLYEHYTHYVPGDSPRMQRFAVALATQYTWLCDEVIAPSESIQDLLRRREANPRISVVPSGVDTARFAVGDRAHWRHRLGIPEAAYVIGHLGRLALEKNLAFLAGAVAEALVRAPGAHFLVVGEGEARGDIQAIAEARGVAGRLHFTGRLHGQALIDAYHAMDVFAFASHSETQGMVVAEAMAAGLPVVAIEAPGVREVVVDGRNGRLLAADDLDAMAEALAALTDPGVRLPLAEAALETAAEYDEPRCAERCLAVYRRAIARGGPFTHADEGGWERVRHRLGAEWQMLRHRGRLLRHLVQEEWEQDRPAWWPGHRTQDESEVPRK